MAMCASVDIDCHVADPRDLLIPTGDDHVHPTPEGYQMLAQRIWNIKLLYDVPM